MNQIYEYFQIFCTALISIGGASAVVIAFVKWLKKPDDKRDDAIKRHDELFDSDNKRLKMLEQKQAETDEAYKILLKSMLAMMSHELDGNHSSELKKAKEELQEYLITR